jgi:hypothetical protein
MIKKYKKNDTIFVQGIRTWKELVSLVKRAEKAGYKYVGYHNIEPIGDVAVFEKDDNMQR